MGPVPQPARHQVSRRSGPRGPGPNGHVHAAEDPDQPVEEDDYGGRQRRGNVHRQCGGVDPCSGRVIAAHGLHYGAGIPVRQGGLLPLDDVVGLEDCWLGLDTHVLQDQQCFARRRQAWLDSRRRLSPAGAACSRSRCGAFARRVQIDRFP